MSKNNYIDNDEFYRIMAEYKEKVIKSKENGTPKPRVSEAIGANILLIANNLATKGNFANYSYIDEMKDDAVENCLKYIDNFDHIKYKKPFAYFTTIVYYAFVRRINNEKKEQYVKYKMLENFLIYSQLEPNGSSVDMNVIDNDITNTIIKNYEDFIQRKKDAQKKVPEKFIEKKGEE